MFDLSSVNWGLFGLWYVVFLFSLTVHEGAHALVAHLGGDDTAYHGGQVTLNPLPHMRQEPFGTMLFPALSFLAFGWVMGWARTPYDPLWADRYPRRAALMSLAGPAANFSLALIALIAARLLLAAGVFVSPTPEEFSFYQVVSPATGDDASLGIALAYTLSMTLVLNVLLGAFNLIPLPPLDGSGVLLGFLPERAADRYREFLSAPGLRFMGLLALWFGFGRIVGPLYLLILFLLY